MNTSFHFLQYLLLKHECTIFVHFSDCVGMVAAVFLHS